MPLAAEQVIQHIAGRLAIATAAQDRVYTSRLWPISADSLPAIKVFAGDELTRKAQLGGQTHEAELEVNAAGLVRSVDQVDQDMNALASEMLAALFDEPVPFDLELVATKRDIKTEGQADVGAITLQLRATFFFDAAAPETIVST